MIADRIERNKKMKKLMMLAVAVAAAMPLMAVMETVGGYTWAGGTNGGKAKIVV